MRFPNSFFEEEELKNTPKRIKKFEKEWTKKHNFKFTTFPNQNYDQLIILKCEFASICTHHLLPFKGVAYIGYIPDKKICGISKLARVVDKFACRPQIQERLTHQIAKFVEEQLKPFGVMVVLKAKHDCMIIRGVRKPNSEMITSVVRGVFAKPPKGKNPREEFLKLIGAIK